MFWVFSLARLAAGSIFSLCTETGNITNCADGQWVQTPRHFFGGHDPGFSMPMVWWEGEACTFEKRWRNVMSGKVMLAQWEGCSTEVKARFAEGVGAAVLIILDDGENLAGRDVWQSRDYSPVSDIQIPIYTVAESDARPWIETAPTFSSTGNVLVNSSGGVSVLVLAVTDANPWAFVNKHLWIAQVLGSLLVFHNIVIAATRWRLFVRQAAGKLRVPVACLSTQVVANFFRLLSVAIDPFGYRGIYPRLAFSVVCELGTPFAAFSSVMLSIYWREVREGKRARGFLDTVQRRVQAALMGAALLAFNLVVSILMGTYHSRPILLRVSQWGFGTIETFVWVWFAYEACKTHRILADGKQKSQKAETHKQVQVLAVKMVIYAFMMFQYSVFCFLGAGLALAPERQILVEAMGAATSYLASTAEIYMFKPDNTPTGRENRRRSSAKSADYKDNAPPQGEIRLKRKSEIPNSRSYPVVNNQGPGWSKEPTSGASDPSPLPPENAAGGNPASRSDNIGNSLHTPNPKHNPGEVDIYRRQSDTTAPVSAIPTHTTTLPPIHDEY